MSGIANTPEPPYYAVIFTSLRTTGDNGYGEAAARMLELAAVQDGFLSVESARDGLGITVFYWRDLESIRKWHSNAEHRLVQQKGYEQWYTAFKTRICHIQRDYGFGDAETR